MTKVGLILPICLVIISGCSLCDCQNMASETAAESVTVAESEPVTVAASAEIATPQGVAPPPVSPRILTSADVRRLQTGLREIGFDPGPVDGVAGGRTKAAYVRLHTGCSTSAPLFETSNASVTEGKETAGNQVGDQPLNGEETKRIQSQLRNAGFDPGPVDGIFGSRTQSALRQFQRGCLMAKEFEGMLSAPLPASLVAESADARPAQASLSSLSSQAVGGLPPRGEDNQAVVSSVRAREQVRILQLRLRDAGFDPGPFDGVMGSKTRSALAQYEASQRDKKIKTSLKTTGVIAQY
jgi:peptidoglycan hydrolase-like protein with peptidoglycan-binding domain